MRGGGRDCFDQNNSFHPSVINLSDMFVLDCGTVEGRAGVDNTP